MLLSAISEFIGNEAINFQANSRLGKDLENCFQKAFIYRDTLNYGAMMSEDDRRNFRVKKVIEYVDKVMASELIKICKQDANLDVIKVDTTYWGNCPVYTAAMERIVIDRTFSGVTKEASNGKYFSDKELSDNKKYLDDICRLAETFDPVTGTLNGKVASNEPLLEFVSIIYIDPYLFLWPDFAPKGIEPATAEELAAVMLHEIGHSIGQIENISKLYFFRQRSDNVALTLCDSLKTTGDAKKIIKETSIAFRDVANSAIKKSAALSSDSQRCIQKAFSSLTTTVNNISEFAESLEDDKDISSPSMLSTAGQLLAFVLKTIIKVLFFCVFLNIAFVIFFGLKELIENVRFHNFNDANIHSLSGKNSDTTISYRQTRADERSADEFTVRQGYGPQLVSALNKFVRAQTATVGGKDNAIGNSILMNSSTFAAATVLIGDFIQNTSLMTYAFIYTYEDFYDRMKRVKQDTIAFFKNNNVPGPIADEWIAKMERLDKVIEESKVIRDRQPFKFIISIIRRFATPAGWYNILRDGNLTEDYEKLQNQIDGMSRNDLFYQAAKLDRMFS